MILVSSRVPGWITEFGVDEGDRVAIGDVLLQVDARDARYKLTALEASLGAIEADIERSRARNVMVDQVRELYAQFGPMYRWIMVLIGSVGSFAALLTSTIVNVAIPDIMGALGITLDQAQWLSTAFLASGTVTMLLTAWFIQAFDMVIPAWFMDSSREPTPFGK